jgi:hypothetical protein
MYDSKGILSGSGVIIGGVINVAVVLKAKATTAKVEVKIS